ncbi:hypothetical protein [Bradyrhizobium sp.]|uniref:hypothetical protein n=1 Tax=Bradyrhizobium sp. TaxID=376 RepID=UPI0025BFB27E|nr:hypothetical protein [Bradyrhizobium sp.]
MAKLDGTARELMALPAEAASPRVTPSHRRSRDTLARGDCSKRMLRGVNLVWLTNSWPPMIAKARSWTIAATASA